MEPSLSQIHHSGIVMGMSDAYDTLFAYEIILDCHEEPIKTNVGKGHTPRPSRGIVFLSPRSVTFIVGRNIFVQAHWVTASWNGSTVFVAVDPTERVLVAFILTSVCLGMRQCDCRPEPPTVRLCRCSMFSHVDDLDPFLDHW